MRRRYVLILGSVFLLLCMTGCALQKKEKKLRDVEYTVVGAEDVPQELQEEINKIKDEEFQLTYDDGAYLYMAKGYGTRESSGHNISVQQVYLTEHTIVFETQITGPAEGTDAANKETTPYIVIKTERLDGQVIFE